MVFERVFCRCHRESVQFRRAVLLESLLHLHGITPELQQATA
jgi:hypothetical protein